MEKTKQSQNNVAGKILSIITIILLTIDIYYRHVSPEKQDTKSYVIVVNERKRQITKEIYESNKKWNKVIAEIDSIPSDTIEYSHVDSLIHILSNSELYQKK